ncbi:MAG: HlyD family efflux transporter periplasmic adaptor subunit [Rubrivivax sp.]|nr:HlyD family efflux transporter periplasmic adaptor subunit [Rubrivivax sp.]
MSALSVFKRKRVPELQRGDVPYLNAVQAAQVMDPAPAAMWAVYLLLLAIAVATTWAAMSQVDIVAKANGRVVPDGREQVIASLEGGILREMLVREGQEVVEGQALASLDPTRFESQQAEGTAKKLALQGTLARLHAEADGTRLQFPEGVPDAVVQGETESHEARQRVLNEAVDTSRRSAGLLARELAMAESMSSKGLMSEVEVMRVRRQVNDLQLQTQERINRFRQEAAGELVRVRNELAQLDEQMVVRDDALRRTTLVSPVKGVVKTIRANTVGGVIAPGAPVMELLPIGPRVLVEARVKPADIGFVKTGQTVQVKLTAYEYTVYGGLEGTVVSISPDAMGDPEKAAQPEGTWYRAMVRADPAGLRKGDQPLPVLPGMTGSVEIRTGQRSVLGFLLRPMLKSQEAFRER